MFDKKLYRSDMVRCVLCSDAPCTKACGRIDPARMLRSTVRRHVSARGRFPSEA